MVARHLQRRGLAWRTDLEDLREHPAAALRVYATGGRTRRAMMARISDPHGGTTGVELTYLNPNGGRAMDLKVSRKIVGMAPGGSAVRLSPAAEIMLVGEGVVTTLSAMVQFHRPGWALLSAGNLARWRAPDGVRDVLIAADRGPAGATAARSLHDRLQADGVVSAIAWPWEPWGDWNEVLTAQINERMEEGGAGRRSSGDRPRLRQETSHEPSFPIHRPYRRANPGPGRHRPYPIPGCPAGPRYRA